MLRLMLIPVLLSLAVCCLSASSKEVSQVAYELARKNTSETEWNAYVSGAKKRYETWANDNDNGSLKNFLDSKLVEIAPGALTGNASAIKKLVLWVALYVEFKEPAHSRLQAYMESNEAAFTTLVNNFTWDGAARISALKK